MEKEKIISTLIDYIEDNLTAIQVREVERQLKNNLQWQQLLGELQSLDQIIDQAAIKQPSINSKRRFQEFLATENQINTQVKYFTTNNSKTISLNQVWQIAAAIALVIMGTGIGVQWKNNLNQQTEIAALKSEMLLQKKLLALSLLEQSSASDRIKGVNISIKETNKDEQILAALIERMNLDENINVQLKAIEGLAQFGQHRLVITAFTKALNKQASPEIQIAIMDALMNLNAKDAYPQFQRILRDEQTIDAVKNKAAAGLDILL